MISLAEYTYTSCCDFLDGRGSATRTRIFEQASMYSLPVAVLITPLESGSGLSKQGGDLLRSFTQSVFILRS